MTAFKAMPAPYWWHGGTTCHHHCTIAWVSAQGRYVLLKHTGHSQSIGRSMSSYCAAHYALFDMATVGDQRSVWSKPELAMSTWTGRWTKERQRILEKLIMGHNNEST